MFPDLKTAQEQNTELRLNAESKTNISAEEIKKTGGTVID
jgi:hypothetical protein